MPDYAGDRIQGPPGLIGQRPLSASALCQVLGDYFQVPVDVEQFTGAWYALDRPTQCEFQEGDTVEVDADSAAGELRFQKLVPVAA